MLEDVLTRVVVCVRPPDGSFADLEVASIVADEL